MTLKLHLIRKTGSAIAVQVKTIHREIQWLNKKTYKVISY